MDQDYLKETHENTSLEEFFKTVLKLKSVLRQGWKNKAGLQSPESVADHCYSLSTIAMVISDIKKLDTGKILRMSLLHDLAEAITGDLTPEDVTKSKKAELERDAMKTILLNLSEPIRTQYLSIWDEYQKNDSKEAQLLHQLDKLEMAMQAKEYERFGIKKETLVPFFESAKNEITDSDLQKILSRFL